MLANAIMARHIKLPERATSWSEVIVHRTRTQIPPRYPVEVEWLAHPRMDWVTPSFLLFTLHYVKDVYKYAKRFFKLSVREARALLHFCTDVSIIHRSLQWSEMFVRNDCTISRRYEIRGASRTLTIFYSFRTSFFERMLSGHSFFYFYHNMSLPKFVDLSFFQSFTCYQNN